MTTSLTAPPVELRQHPLYQAQLPGPADMLTEPERSVALRRRIRWATLCCLAKRPHAHTELVCLVRAQVYGPFRGDFSALREMRRQKDGVASVLRCMFAEGDISTTATRAATTYYLPRAAT